LLDGRFELRRVLGFGALGTTYVARDRVSRTEVLVKILSPQLVPTLDDCEQLGTQLEMFEGRVIAGSAMHIEVGLADLLLFVTYPIIQGVSLREVLEARANAGQLMTKEESLRVLLGIVASVSALHSATPHGALRPENVMITPKGVILTNGAIVGAVSPDYFQPRMRGYAQAVPYIAPEVMAGKKVTATADLFAIGAMAAELLTGSPSAHGLEVSELSPAIIQGIRQLLERDRTKRPGGQALILNELCKLCGLDRRPPDAPLALADTPSVVEESDDSTTVSAAPTRPPDATSSPVPSIGRAFVQPSAPPSASMRGQVSPTAHAPQAPSTPSTPSSPQAITQPSLPTARVGVGKPAQPAAQPSTAESPPAVRSSLPMTTIPRSGIPGGSSSPAAPQRPAPSPAGPSSAYGAKGSLPPNTSSTSTTPSPRASVPPPSPTTGAAGPTRSSFPPRPSSGAPSVAKLASPGPAPVIQRGLPTASTPSIGNPRPSMPSVPKVAEPVSRPSTAGAPSSAAPSPRVPNLAGLEMSKPAAGKPGAISQAPRALEQRSSRVPVPRDPDPARTGFSDIDTGEIELLDD
jgi:serine/threonine-protein kinase